MRKVTIVTKSRPTSECHPQEISYQQKDTIIREDNTISTTNIPKYIFVVPYIHKGNGTIVPSIVRKQAKIVTD
jgi:hypothetical protein